MLVSFCRWLSQRGLRAASLLLLLPQPGVSRVANLIRVSWVLAELAASLIGIGLVLMGRGPSAVHWMRAQVGVFLLLLPIAGNVLRRLLSLRTGWLYPSASLAYDPLAGRPWLMGALIGFLFLAVAGSRELVYLIGLRVAPPSLRLIAFVCATAAVLPICFVLLAPVSTVRAMLSVRRARQQVSPPLTTWRHRAAAKLVTPVFDFLRDARAAVMSLRRHAHMLWQILRRRRTPDPRL